MAEYGSNKNSKESEEDSGQERMASEGRSRYGRLGASESIDDWTKRQEEKRSGGSKKIPARRSGLKRGKLNPVSKKQKKKNADYTKAKSEHYKNEINQSCALCGTTKNLSVHHAKKRLEGNISNSSTFITLCLIGDYMDRTHPTSNHSHSGGCHSWIEANKTWARENGYLE